MNLDFSEEQKDLREQLARFLAGQQCRAGTRDALDGRAPYDAKLWRNLGELGWLSVAIPESLGGQGLGHGMLCCVAHEVGRSLAAVPMASSVFLATEAILQYGSKEQKQRLLPLLGAGKRIGALAIAETVGPLSADSVTARVDDGRLTGTKIAVADGGLCDLLVVAAMEEGKIRLFLVEASGAGVVVSKQAGVDPSHAPATIEFEAAPAEPLGEAPFDWSDIRRLLDRAAVLVAFEQIGTADGALAMALDYVRERKAFGRTIGSFQAIKHKLADVWMANELARANAYYAAWAIESNADALPLAAATARVSASEALERAARELVQVHGGIAVTWEHDAHLFYRRGKHLGLLLGTAAEWQRQVVDNLASAATGAQ